MSECEVSVWICDSECVSVDSLEKNCDSVAVCVVVEEVNWLKMWPSCVVSYDSS